MPVLGGTRPGGDANGDVTLFRERLQQAYDIARERSAGSKRWQARCKLYRLTVIDAVGDGVIGPAGDSWSQDHELSAAAAAVNGDLHHGGAIGATTRKCGGGDHRRVVYRRG